MARDPGVFDLLPPSPVAETDARQNLGGLDRKNLSDEYAFLSTGNTPGAGGNTGTAESFASDLQGVAIRPRQIELELTWRY